MKKNIIIIFSLIVIFLTCLCVFFVALKNSEKNNSNSLAVSNKFETNIQTNNEQDLDTIKIADIEDKDVVLSQESELNYAINIMDSSVRNENADFIVIGTIESIDGGINYNSTTKEYTNIQTIGNLKINKIVKGEIKEDIIPYIRLGGKIKFSEYEKGLNEAQKNKLETLDNIKELTDYERENKYVSYSTSNNISIEVGKTYLMYLNYNNDFERYGIVFLEQGLREIQDSSVSEIRNNSSKELSIVEEHNIRIKNNITGEYEILSDVIGDLKN